MGRRHPGSRVRLEPLWLRIERNRVRRAAFLAGFAIVSSALVAVVTLAIVALPVGLAHLLMAYTSLRPESYPLYGHTSAFFRSLPATASWIWGAWLLAAIAYEWRALSRPVELDLLASGARLVPRGEGMATKNALKEIALAAGVTPAPALYVLPSRSANALLVSRGSHRPACAVTEGLLERFTAEEQRAVFANLLARLQGGDIAWATTVSSLMAPLWRWRAASLSSERSRAADAVRFLAGDRRVAGHDPVEGTELSRAEATGCLVLMSFWVAVAYAVAVVASEIVAAAQRRTHLVSAEAADAEGMLLLKEPVAMLRALRKAIEADNRVRVAMPAYSGLFYIWAGDDVVDDEDPEWRRLDRLRQVVGVDGAMDAEAEALEAACVERAVAGSVPPAPPAAAQRRGHGA